jgi:hypothetical protein
MICFSVLFLVLPIVNLAYSGYYKDEINCNFPNITNSDTVSNLAITIGIPTWLNVHGAITIVEIANLLYAVYSGMKYKNCARSKEDFLIVTNCCSYLLSFMIAMFRTAWIIIGCVLFWRDCPNVSPKPINDLMYATLIMGLIGLWTSYASMGGSKFFIKNQK